MRRFLLNLCNDALDILPRFRQMAAETGRNPDEVPMSVFAAPQDAERLKRYRDAGVDRAVFMIATTGRDEALKNLDAAAAVARSVS
jgi:hypothetical protein